MADSVRDIIDRSAARYGVPSTALQAIAQIESGGNPNAYNKSGAAGLFQFMPGTARDYGLSDPYDPAAAADAAARYAQNSINALTPVLGRQPTAGELYLSHQQGPGGAKALLSDPGANVVDALTGVYGSRSKAAQAVLQNGGNLGMTAGQFSGMWVNKANALQAKYVPPANIPAQAPQPLMRPAQGQLLGPVVGGLPIMRPAQTPVASAPVQQTVMAAGVQPSGSLMRSSQQPRPEVGSILGVAGNGGVMVQGRNGVLNSITQSSPWWTGNQSDQRGWSIGGHDFAADGGLQPSGTIY